MTTRCLTMPRFSARLPIIKGLAVIVCLAVTAPSNQASADDAEVFVSPEIAFSKLVDAAAENGINGVLAILGPKTEEWVSSGDPVQDRIDFERFIAAYDTTHRVTVGDDGVATLLVGKDDFPFPFPVLKTSSGWAFDVERGKEELLSRRIGRNELAVVRVLQAVSDAQHEYASLDRNGNDHLEFATSLISEEGQHDGLYWPTADGEPLSPLGPLIAEAQERSGAADGETSPSYHGYHYALLSGQGDATPGGALYFVEDGLAIGGFGIIAYPATYGNSGIMTLIIGYDGDVFQANLGPETREIALSIDLFDPGEGWTKIDLEEID
jgi:hypothetical protein